MIPCIVLRWVVYFANERMVNFVVFTYAWHAYMANNLLTGFSFVELDMDLVNKQVFISIL